MHQLNVLFFGPNTFFNTLIELKSYLKFNLEKGDINHELNSLKKFDILKSKKELVDSYIEIYLNENVGFEINGRKYKINYLGHEYINGTINCYFEVLKIKKIKKLIITDRSLFSDFEDQENLIYFEMLNDLSVLRLKNPQQKEEIIFTQ